MMQQLWDYLSRKQKYTTKVRIVTGVVKGVWWWNFYVIVFIETKTESTYTGRDQERKKKDRQINL